TVYEQAHGVLIDDEALQAAAVLSDRYISGRQLPDKAIDVLDTAAARVAINLTSAPRQVSALKNELYHQGMEIEMLEREQRLSLSRPDERLSVLQQQRIEIEQQLIALNTGWEKQQHLVQQIIALRAVLLAQEESATDEQVVNLTALSDELERLQQHQTLVSPHVDKSQIAAVIAEWTGVPLNRLSQSELAVVTELPSYLGQQIKGQETAIHCLHQHLLTARADLRRPGRPMGAFLLVGPSGVGKTETVLQIADLLYGGRQYLTTINMSEFQEKHTVSRLIGSPPGYVGYGEGGVLTEAIRQKPYSVVLLDEVEKAHPDVLNLFYQAFDKGELADGEGRIIDCKNIVFFLTSNLGYQTIVDHADEPALLNERLYPELSAFFKPALLARMEVVPYLPLGMETLQIIIHGKLNRLDTLLRQRFSADVVIEPEVIDEILLRATRAENGARMLESIIDGALLPPVSLLLLQKVAAGTAISHIRIAVEGNVFTAQVEGAI
ncbi:AAA domain-containing protein, partial [Yersinia pestis]|nr:AAA domain-containing protein [Yersinia pestis]